MRRFIIVFFVLFGLPNDKGEMGGACSMDTVN
jgi:hypothetical protein